jgi:hypothetical protein
MTLANNNIILQSDIDAGLATPLANLASDNARITLGSQINFIFDNITSATASTFNTLTYVAPDDMLIDDIACASGNISGSCTVTLAGAGIISPISITWTGVGAALTDAARIFASPTQPFLTMLRGATYTLTATTADAAAPAAKQKISVCIICRNYFRRD